jgi:hypothetical protein
MIPDFYITELRLKAVRKVPGSIPAVHFVEMRDEDFDVERGLAA